MKKGPKVSIIIPTYKRHDMVSRAVDSALKQTYKNIEVIVVDDNIPGSIDRKKTEKALKKFFNNKKFKYIQLEKNSGGPIARNTGFENSTGDFVNFLDDDDYFLPNKIEMQIAKFNDNDNVGIVGCYCVVKDEHDNIKRYDKKKYKGNVFKQELIDNVCSTPVALIRRELFNNIGGFENVISSQEHVMFIKAFNENPNYDLVEDVLVVVNHHNGIRVSNNSKRVIGTLQLYDHVQKYFETLSEREIKNVRIHHLINITTVYALGGNKKEAFKYWKEALRENKLINRKIFKGLIAIIFGRMYEPFVSKLSLIFDIKK